MKQDMPLIDGQLQRINSELVKQGVKFDMVKINQLLELGYLADLFKCEPKMLDRQEWKKVLGIGLDTTRFDDAFMRDYYPSLGNVESGDKSKSTRVLKLDQLSEFKPYWNASYRFLAIDDPS